MGRVAHGAVGAGDGGRKHRAAGSGDVPMDVQNPIDRPTCRVVIIMITKSNGQWHLVDLAPAVVDPGRFGVCASKLTAGKISSTE